MSKVSIPADVADHLRQIEQVTSARAKRLEYLHLLWGEGAQDDADGDEWQVEIDHSEVERLIRDLRQIGEFSAWLASFEKGAAR